MNPISRLPWSLKAHKNSSSTSIVDADGKTISVFTDFRDAEYVINLASRVTDLEKQLEIKEDKTYGSEMFKDC